MYKKVNVVMLPTNEKANIVLHKDKNTLEYILNQSSVIGETQYFSCQHLYILSDEEIKVGDWVYDVCDGIVNVEHEYQLSNIMVFKKDCKKIIATTDKSLTINSVYGIDSFDAAMFGGKSEMIKLPQMFNLPQIPQSFIKHFVSEYNKGNIITEVIVEYYWEPFSGIAQLPPKVKINKDNTINIKLIKNSWSRDEVKELLYKFSTKVFSENFKIEEVNKWIEENL